MGSVASCSDTFVTPPWANAGGLFAGASANFFFQQRAFGAILPLCRGGTRATLVRYTFAEVLIVTSQQVLFVLGLQALHWHRDSQSRRVSSSADTAEKVT